MTIDANALRGQLRNFRTRASTINYAVAAGPEAVEPAIELLNDRNEATRWSAIKILSEIGDPCAVPPLIALLERGKSALEVANALRAITGRDFGEDAAAWLKWASNEKTVETSTAQPLELSDDALVETATRDFDARIASKGNRYRVEVSLPEGRKQVVYIDFGAKDSEDAPLVRLYTPCAQADEGKYEWALKNNMNLSYGAIGLARMEGKRWFTMVDTHLRATIHPEELAKSILTLAGKGDVVEKLLSDRDKY